MWNDPCEYYRPSRIVDQHFGLGLEAEDMYSPLVSWESRGIPRCTAGYLRPWRSLASRHDTGSSVSLDKNKFQANLDVQQFHPQDITVKVAGDNTITIEGKHEEKQDEHGYISRHFIRRYVVPKGHDMNRIESKLSSDGVLTITAPKVDIDMEKSRTISITHTGQPSRLVVKDKKEEKKN